MLRSDALSHPGVSCKAESQWRGDHPDFVEKLCKQRPLGSHSGLYKADAAISQPLFPTEDIREHLGVDHRLKRFPSGSICKYRPKLFKGQPHSLFGTGLEPRHLIIEGLCAGIAVVDRISQGGKMPSNFALATGDAPGYQHRFHRSGSFSTHSHISGSSLQDITPSGRAPTWMTHLPVMEPANSL